MPALIRSSCLVATVVVALLASVMPVAAQAPRGESRVALVIGNGNYRETPLRNPVNDVRAVAKALRELGFDVLAHENANKRTMETAIIEFGRRLTDAVSASFTTPATACRCAGTTTWSPSMPTSIPRRSPGSPTPPRP